MVPAAEGAAAGGAAYRAGQICRVQAAGPWVARGTVWELLVVGVVAWLMLAAFALALARLAAINDAGFDEPARELR